MGKSLSLFLFMSSASGSLLHPLLGSTYKMVKSSNASSDFLPIHFHYAPNSLAPAPPIAEVMKLATLSSTRLQSLRQSTSWARSKRLKGVYILSCILIKAALITESCSASTNYCRLTTVLHHSLVCGTSETCPGGWLLNWVLGHR